jgi:predicted transcriptional regulator
VKDARLAVRLDADLSEALAELADVEDRSRSQIVRSLIGAYVAARAEVEEVDRDG